MLSKSTSGAKEQLWKTLEYHLKKSEFPVRKAVFEAPSIQRYQAPSAPSSGHSTFLPFDRGQRKQRSHKDSTAHARHAEERPLPYKSTKAKRKIHLNEYSRKSNRFLFLNLFSTTHFIY